MARMLLGKMGEFSNRVIEGDKNDKYGLKGCYGFVFVPAVAASSFTARGFEAEDVVILVGGERRHGALVKAIQSLPVMKKFQVSYRAGSRWGSRVVMAESQEKANELVREEINKSIGARPVR